MLDNYIRFFISNNYTNKINNLTKFIGLVSDTLNNIYENIENKGYDFIDNIELNDNVLEINLKSNKTYIINIQKNNKQIWLSSPFSGPKRFEYINNKWIDIHNKDNKLNEILNKEFNTYYKLIGKNQLKLL